ncbi:hypothetical protein C8R45DRAFT_938739 [Mycena sanguinolenta]|nr:hypothetical protein C8R45DRAFT_938739 [Mycena sanguinolenta]
MYLAIEFQVSAGLVVSMVLMAVALSLFRSSEFDKDLPVDGAGILHTIWLYRNHPRLQQILEQVEHPSDENLRAAGMVQTRLVAEGVDDEKTSQFIENAQHTSRCKPWLSWLSPRPPIRAGEVRDEEVEPDCEALVDVDVEWCRFNQQLIIHSADQHEMKYRMKDKGVGPPVTDASIPPNLKPPREELAGTRAPEKEDVTESVMDITATHLNNRSSHFWELESAASNGGGTSGGTGAELSGNDQIISICTPSLRQRKCRKRKGVPASPAGVDAESTRRCVRPRIRSGAARVDEGARSAPHLSRVVGRTARALAQALPSLAGLRARRGVFVVGNRERGGRRKARIRCAPCEFHAARVYPALRPPGALPAALALLVFIPHCTKLARRHRPRRLLAVSIRHRHRYAARRHPARAPRTWNRAPRAARRSPPCSTSFGSVAGRWREEQDAPVSHVIEGGTCINCAAAAAAARSGVMPPVLYPKLSQFHLYISYSITVQIVAGTDQNTLLLPPRNIALASTQLAALQH